MRFLVFEWWECVKTKRVLLEFKGFKFDVFENLTKLSNYKIKRKRDSKLRKSLVFMREYIDSECLSGGVYYRSNADQFKFGFILL